MNLSMPSIFFLWLIITLRTRTSILAMLNGNTTYNFFSLSITSLDLSTKVKKQTEIILKSHVWTYA